MTKIFLARRCRSWPGLALAALLAVTGSAAAQSGAAVPPGVYRTAAQFRQRHPAPAAVDVRPSEKRNALVATAQRGLVQTKVFVPRDSAWGYADAKGHAYRLGRNGEEYRVEQADTLVIYSSNATAGGAARPLGAAGPAGTPTYTARRYYFSRGLGGLVFPLTAKLLREAFETSTPAFVAALRELPFGQELSAHNKETGEFRVVALFRQSLGK